MHRTTVKQWFTSSYRKCIPSWKWWCNGVVFLAHFRP